MKKLKKLFAVMLSLIMVLAMGITSFAATNSATITVSGLDADATVTYKQIIRPNTQTATGWEFVDKTDIPKFGKYTEDDEQAVIWKLIKMESGSATNMPANTVAFTTSEYQDALKKIATSDLPSDATYNKIAGTCEWNVSSAGVYVINANSTVSIHIMQWLHIFLLVLMTQQQVLLPHWKMLALQLRVQQ